MKINFTLFIFITVTSSLFGDKYQILNELHTAGFTHIKASDIETLKGSGSNTEAVYAIRGVYKDKPQEEVVCKVLKGRKQERLHLESLKSLVLHYESFMNESSKEFPPAFPIFASYRGYVEAKQDEFLLFRKAPGQSVFDLMREWSYKGYSWSGLDPDDSKYHLSYAFENIGKAIATFHLRYGSYDSDEGVFKTITHGDLHTSNIFYDLWSNETTFIDYETMAASQINHKNVFGDIDRLLNFSKFETEKYVEEDAAIEYIQALGTCFVDEQQRAEQKKYVGEKLKMLGEFFSFLSAGYEKAFTAAGYKIDFNALQIKKSNP